MTTRDPQSITRGRNEPSEPGAKITSGAAPCSTSSNGPSMRRQQRHRRRRLSSAAATAAAAALGNDTLSSYFASATSASMTASSPPSPLLAFLGRRRRRAGSSCPPDSDSEDEGAGGTSLPLPALLARRPDALLAAAVPRAAVLFGAGAAAGALGKTLTAPLDRVKLLLQTSGGFETGAIRAATAGGGPLAAASRSSVGRGGARSVSRVVDALAAIGRQEGVAGLWRGNLPQILKVVPYSATQLCAYELFKRALAPEEAAEEEKREGASSSSSSSSPSSRLSVGRRLAAGAAAGMVATLATHPLDTLRLRMAVDPAARSLPAAVKLLASEGGVRAFYRGLGASVAGIAPYMAIELSTFDLLAGSGAGSAGGAAALPPFARGLLAAGLATTLCYPLDTARRRVQLGVASAAAASSSFSSASAAAASSSSGVAAAVRQGKLIATALALAREEGVPALYRGFVPSCLKNLPNKGVKLSVFDGAKRALAASEAALAEERARVAGERERRRRRRRGQRKNGLGGLMARVFGGGAEKKKAILH